MILIKKEIIKSILLIIKYKYCMESKNFIDYIISTTFHGIYIDQWRKLCPKAVMILS